MRYIRFFTLFFCVVLIQMFFFNSVVAQTCSSASISITAVQINAPSVCYDDGQIQITINGVGLLLDDPSKAPQLTLTPVDGMSGVEVLDASLPGTGNIRTFTGVVGGVYYVNVKAFCQDNHIQYIVGTMTTTVTIVSTYVPMEVTPTATRKSLNCKGTGQITCNFVQGKGKMPFEVKIIAFTPALGSSLTYPVPTTFSNINVTNYNIEGLPAGSYTFSITDACSGTAPTVKSESLGAVANDFPSSAITGGYGGSDGSCTITLPRAGVSYSGDADQQYYWSHWSTYYERAFLVNNTGTKEWGDIGSWSYDLSTHVPPFTSYGCFCGNTLDLYVRVKGCTSEKSQQVISASGGSYICKDPFTTATTMDGTNCDSARLNISFDSWHALCYSMTWTITVKNDPEGNLPVGTVMASGVTLGGYNNWSISDATTSINYRRGITYTIKATESGDCPRTFTKDWTPPLGGGQSFTTYNQDAYNYVKCRWRLMYISSTPELIAPGTQIKYVSGPMDLPDLPVGGTFIIPSNFNSATFYIPYTNHKTSSDMIMMKAGTYKFEVTNNCGMKSSFSMGVSNHYEIEPFAYTETNSCEGVRVKPSHRIAQYDVSGNVTYPQTSSNGTWYYIYKAPAGVTVSTIRVPYSSNPNQGYLVFPSPGEYIIATTYTESSGYCDYRRDTINIGAADFLWVDPNSISSYVCAGDTFGHIYFEAEKGVAPYTYELWAPSSSSVGGSNDCNVIDYQMNTAGAFPYSGCNGGIYQGKVTDACGNSMPINITMRNLKNATVAWTPKYIYCEDEPIQLNCLALGRIITYEWQGDNGWYNYVNDNRPRPKATIHTLGTPPYTIPNYANEGNFQVYVVPQNCGVHNAVTGVITGITLTTGGLAPFDPVEDQGECYKGASGVYDLKDIRVPLVVGADLPYDYTLPAGWTSDGNWAVSGGYFIIQNVKIPKGAPASNTYKISVSAKNNCSTPVTTDVFVPIISAFPLGDISSIIAPVSACYTSGSLTLSIPAMENVTYFWEETMGASYPLLAGGPINWVIASGQGTNEVTFNFPPNIALMPLGNFKVTVTATTGCKDSKSSPSAVVYVMMGVPGLSGVIAGDNEVCAGETALLYEIEGAANADDYTWTLPAGWTGPAGCTSCITNSPNILLNAPASGYSQSNIKVVANNICGESNELELEVTVHDTFTAELISTLPTSCGNDNGGIRISISKAGYYSYYINHEINGNFNIAAAGDEVTIDNLPAEIYDIKITLTSSDPDCGTYTLYQVEVEQGSDHVIAPPSVVSPQKFCNMAKVKNLQADGIGIVWYDFYGNPADPEDLLSDGIYYATQTTTEGCEGERSSVMVIITPTAFLDAPNIPNEIELCLPATLADVPTDGNTNIVWYDQIIDGNEVVPEDIEFESDSIYYYYAGLVAGDCESIWRAEVIITIVDEINAPENIEQEQYFCDGALLFDLKTPYDNIVWYSTQSDNDPLEPDTKLTTHTYWAAQQAGSCESTERTPVDVIIGKYPEPITPQVQATCGQTVYLSQLFVIGAGIKWYEGPNITDVEITSPETTIAEPENTYWVAQTAGTCESNRVAISIVSECYSPYGTIFPFVHTGNALFDKQFVTTAKLFIAPPAPTLDKIGFIRKQSPLKEAIVEYYDCTTDPAIVGAPKYPGAIGATNNPGLPINWNVNSGIINAIKLTATDKCPSTPIGRYTFNDVAAGKYVLEIARQGFLTRYGMITVAGSDYLGHRELLAGDTNSDLVVNAKDLSAIALKISSYNTSKYTWKYDFDGNKNTNRLDIQIIQINLNYYNTIYEETAQWINH